MKSCARETEPNSLRAFRVALPNATWEQMRNDALNSGQVAYSEIKTALVRGQRGLCAYCEIRISKSLDPAGIAASANEQRVEHYHSKSDQSGTTNWALEWSNLWIVCNGGSLRPAGGVAANAIYYLPPLPDNLSCDSFKERQIATGKLPVAHEGQLLSPDYVPHSPIIFDYESNGLIKAHGNCDSISIPKDHRMPTRSLIEQTILHYNLNCPRLKRGRRIVSAQLEKLISQTRTRMLGTPPEQVVTILARRMFTANAGTLWLEYFTLIRARLGAAAEDHLKAIKYAG